MNIPTDEQETVITIRRDRSAALVWTSDSTMITKLDKLCNSSPDYYKLIDTGVIEGTIVNKEYKITDKTLISFRSSKTKRQLTDDQRQAIAERFKNIRSRKQ